MVSKKIYTEAGGRKYQMVSGWLSIKTAEITKRHFLYEYGSECGETGSRLLEYVEWGKNKIPVSSIERIPAITVKNGTKSASICGYCLTLTTNCWTVLAEIDESGEYVRLWKAVED